MMLVPEWIIKYWVEWAFGAVIAVFGFMFKHLYGKIKKERQAREALERKANEEKDALKNGMRSLLRRQILIDCKSATRVGFCDSELRDTISEMFDAYSGLGGNGTVKDAYELVRLLPLEKS